MYDEGCRDDGSDLSGAVQAWEEFLKVAPAEDERVVMVLTELDTIRKSLATE